MKKDQWYKILGKDLIEGDITAKNLAEDKLNEDKVDRVAGVVSSYLLRIANDINSLISALESEDTDEMKQKLINALPKRVSDDIWVDTFSPVFDSLAAGKVAKYYKELAKNLKK